MLLILICVIILVLLTCLRFELDLFVEGLSSIFSVGELGQETVVAAFLQKYREKWNVPNTNDNLIFAVIHLKCIKSVTYLFVLVFFEILDLGDSFERLVEVGVEQVDIDSSRTRFGGSIDFEKDWFSFWFLLLLQWV